VVGYADRGVDSGLGKAVRKMIFVYLFLLTQVGSRSFLEG